jgi:hypothetical protein
MASARSRKTRVATLRSRRPDPLDRLGAEEARAVLFALLGRHPDLRPEAVEIARATLATVDVEDVANAVAEAVLGTELDDLNGRAGRQHGRYVSPDEAAWEILDEQVEPFLADLRRLVELGFETAAVATCQGIVRGLRRSRNNRAGLLEWAPDFPGETASEAVAILTRDSRARHGRTWALPEGCDEAAPTAP